ncbi:thioesterase II family protein [Capilliphycus salinus ALCB114379]|uniref:thioesterase II family protein n=1 Tax=Capilliphycus salinus TaxID=2768948 RepID=UPI0039A607D8
MTTTQNFNTWLTCPQPNPEAKLRLFCFHYAGGGALIFRNWSYYFSSSIELCAVELPGRGKRLREPAYTKMKPLIQALSLALDSYLDKPFVFFGHSMGGLVSFELARQLRREYGFTPQHLFVSGCRAPQIPDPDPPIHQLSNSEFIEQLRRYNGTPEAILQNKELMDLLMPCLRADFAVLETYNYQYEPPLNCGITAFNGSADQQVNQADMLAWEDQTGADFYLKTIAGDHFFIHSHQSLLLQFISEEITSILMALIR